MWKDGHARPRAMQIRSRPSRACSPGSCLRRAPLFAHWCLTAGIAHGDFEHFVAHGVQSLSAYGSAKNTPAGATRVFVHALKTVCTMRNWRTVTTLAEMVG